jgi:hypothetical protein
VSTIATYCAFGELAISGTAGPVYGLAFLLSPLSFIGYLIATGMCFSSGRRVAWRALIAVTLQSFFCLTLVAIVVVAALRH